MITAEFLGIGMNEILVAIIAIVAAICIFVWIVVIFRQIRRR